MCCKTTLRVSVFANSLDISTQINQPPKLKTEPIIPIKNKICMLNKKNIKE